jgi:enoyl-CoA hydratase
MSSACSVALVPGIRQEELLVMSDFEQIRYEQDGPVRVITIDRPERMNAIGPRTHAELIEAWGRFRDDDDALVAVLTGAGEKAFCAGGDLKASFAGNHVVPVSEEDRAAHVRGEADGVLGPSRWTDLHKPTIAAVNGVAYAGGLEWACWTDLAIAAEHATFGVTCRRWNIGLADGGTQRLPRIVGFRRAMDLIVTGRVIDAAEAERIGLVNEVVDSGRSLERALELAHMISALPQQAIRTDHEAAVRGFGRPLEEGLRIEAECFDRLIGGSDEAGMHDGLRRFNERDHPDRDPGSDPSTPGIARPNA